jgi:C-terminal processing protease CtpA/Prc
VARGEKQLNLTAELKNKQGETKFMAKNRNEVFNLLGAEFQDVDGETAEKLDIPGGVKVTKLYAGKLMKHTQIREGFIITKVDGQVVKNTEELAKALQNKKGGILIEGVYEEIPGVHYYAFGLT